MVKRSRAPKGTATSNKVLQGETFESSAGRNLTGSIPKLSARTITPGTTDQQVAAGNYLNGAVTVKGDANLKADNIVKDKTIFGITGTTAAMAEQDISFSTPSVTIGNTNITVRYVSPNGTSGSTTIYSGSSGRITGRITSITLNLK